MNDKQRLDFLDEIVRHEDAPTVSFSSFRGRVIMRVEGLDDPHAVGGGKTLRQAIDSADKFKRARVRELAKKQKLVSDDIHGRHYAEEWWDTDSPETEIKAAVSFA